MCPTSLDSVTTLAAKVTHDRMELQLPLTLLNSVPIIAKRHAARANDGTLYETGALPLRFGWSPVTTTSGRYYSHQAPWNPERLPRPTVRCASPDNEG